MCVCLCVFNIVGAHLPAADGAKRQAKPCVRVRGYEYMYVSKYVYVCVHVHVYARVYVRMCVYVGACVFHIVGAHLPAADEATQRAEF